MIRTMWARAGLFAITVMSVGCTPSLDSVTVTQGGDVNLIRVEARVRGASAVSLQTPTVSIARVAGTQAPSFNQVGDMTLATAPVYARDAIIVPQGVIRVQVTVPYRVLFNSTTQTLTRTQDFTVAPPAGCFFFDGADTGQFSVDGFFEIQPPAPGTRADICPGQSPLLIRGNNFPQAYTSVIPGDFSSLAIPTNVPCITSPPAQLPSGFVNFDFVSPNLTGAAGWATANGFEVQARVPLSPPNPANQVQAQLIFQDTAGAFHAEVDSGGTVVFHNLTPAWQALSVSRPGFQVANLHVRMFIPRANQLGSPDSRIEIDRVCPRGGT